MKNNVTVALLLFAALSGFAQWKPQGDKIKTKWAEQVDPNKTLPEYPRPIMERGKWKNLNGLWNYAIQSEGATAPSKYDGKILVPFAVESSLSGVMKTVGSEKELWYETSFTVDDDWKNKDILLHFGAVDWKTEVWLNNIKIGTHTGGYTEFSFNITPFLNGKNQKLVVKVWDPSSDGTQPRGKQVKNPESIWYTPVTGIWQTVWLEPVNKKYIQDIRTTSDIDHNTINIDTKAEGASSSDIVEVTVLDGGKVIASAKSVAGQSLDIAVPNAKLWSPESPFLYDTKIRLVSNGKVVDEVKSYFAMRKISSKRDANGVMRMQLNNKDVFQFGPLDQGWWPDGLYTAPTDEALKYDLVKTKELGFNMIRKHVKVEPARWYTHCDKMGFLVWQDMPSGDAGPIWQMHQYFDGTELKRTAQSEATYKKEWKEIMDQLYSYPSIVVWVPFNEAWGQFKTVEITEWTKQHDPSRLVNSSSGGNHFQTGDILDIHHYPGPELKLYDARRITVLGEYGGIGLPMEGHLWQTDKNWGYTQFKNTNETTAKYKEYANQLIKQAKAGFSAAVYTQTTDVEGEVNGFMTYDRKVDKMNFAEVNKINKEVINSINN
ncbi:beta-galactosidase [Flavobacterium psychrophilum]|nr:beta-galactosidase [Flavobacterium psychrophilum]AOE53710.1 beta-galactosidase [Flavobacterium psychrophilum]